MSQTPTQRINELSQFMATLTERMDGVRRDVEAVSSKCQKTEDSLHEVKRTVAVIEERLTEMKKGIDESGRRRSAVVPSLVGAIIGGLLSFLGQIAIRRFFP
jgi:predicted  nucleic acid-binding Zn-ribbon protein